MVFNKLLKNGIYIAINNPTIPINQDKIISLLFNIFISHKFFFKLLQEKT